MADPSWGSPRKSVKDDVGIALAGFLHQPPLIATSVVVVVRRAHVTWLRTVGRINVATDFDLEVLKSRAVTGFK